MTLRRARDLAATALLPAVLVLLLVLTGCGDVGGPGDTDPVRAGAGAETTREAWVVEDEDDLTQAEIDELALEEWREGEGPWVDDWYCDEPGYGETEEIDMSIPTGTALPQVFADDGTTAALLRTDRSDDAAWATLAELVTAEVDLDGSVDACGDPYLYPPAIVSSDDPAWDGLTADAALTGFADVRCYLVLADARSMQEVAAGGEVTVLWVDLWTTAAEAAEHGLSRSFRSTVGAVAEIEANLAIANMSFFEYADNVDPDGVYRTF